MIKSFKCFILDEATKSECDKKFEKYLFGEFQYKEDDTKKEAAIFKLLKNFVMNNKVTANLPKGLKELESCKEYYRSALMPKAKTVYRKTDIKNTILKKLEWKKSGRNYVAEMNYKAHRKIQSWSSNKAMVIEFESNYYPNSDKSKTTAVILKTNIDNSFIMNAGFMNKIDKYVKFDSEYEIIRFSNKLIKVKAYIDSFDYDHIINKVK